MYFLISKDPRNFFTDGKLGYTISVQFTSEASVPRTLNVGQSELLQTPKKDLSLLRGSRSLAELAGPWNERGKPPIPGLAAAAPRRGCGRSSYSSCPLYG